MKRFFESENRRQATLLPDSLEDYVTDENPVRVTDVFIDELELAAKGFAGVAPARRRSGKVSFLTRQSKTASRAPKQLGSPSPVRPSSE
jgi:hypothetical protein